ncbi:heterotrimeric G-protein alpha subunit, GPA3-like protein, partial [Coprinopsis sp. MPI-PUGE-AT-0042]
GNISLLPAVRRRAARARARSDKIDEQIEEERRRFKRECKVLLMGTDQSETSTMVKHMKINHWNGFSLEERSEFRPVVYKNVVESAHQVLNYMVKAELSGLTYSNRALADRILDFLVTTLSDAHPYLPSEIAEAIHHLWNDPMITEIKVEHGSRFDLTDTMRVLSQRSPTYRSTRLRAQRNGCVESTSNVGRYFRDEAHDGPVHLIDVGTGNQRAERRKWIHHFENVTSVMFCTALSDYDQMLSEGKIQNRMAESLTLWESVINSRWFLRTSLLLFFTRVDDFKNKLPKVPLERYFPEYTGGTDINKAAKYILWKFMQANRARLSVYP